MSYCHRPAAGLLAGLIVLVLSLSPGCGGSSGDAGAAEPEGPSEEQLRIGFGPVREISLGAIDADLVAEGEELFTVKCTACHRLDSRYVAPPLGDVTTRRSPEFIMNMILNPEGMVQQHPEVRALLTEYLTPMPNQQLTEDEARAILEYLRQAADST